ncbi:MAG: hypothetical protein ABIN61_02710 [candidate division WOR-3 bacterium]
MFLGDIYNSRRFSLYESFPFNFYKDKFYYFMSRDIQIINLFSVDPISIHQIIESEIGSEEKIIKELRIFLEVPEDYKLLLLPNRFAAYYLAFFTVADVGDEILTPAPIPYFLRQYADVCALTIKWIETKSAEDFELPLRREVEDSITPRTKIFYFSEPNFSGNIIYSKDSLERIIFISRNYQLFLLTDETLSTLFRDKEGLIFTKNFALNNERIIRINNFLREFFLGDLTAFIFHSTLPSKIELIAHDLFPVIQPQLSNVDYFLKHSEELLQGRLQKLEQNRIVLQSFLDSRPDVVISYPNTISSVFLKLPVPNADTFVEWLLCEYNWDKRTVFVAPASLFHSKEYEEEGEVLIDYSYLNPEILEEGLEILGEALNRYLGLSEKGVVKDDFREG